MPETPYLTHPPKTDKMPPGVPFIVGNEAAERFSYYGMNSILVPFMTLHMLNSVGAADHMSGTQADAWYHFFVGILYVLSLMGAFLADAVIGKYKTILFLSIVYCFGHLALSLNHTRWGLVFGLVLIALGAGGIKPCVSANVGDQFGASNQHLLTKVFNWFYFSINAGSAVSTLLIPWLLGPAVTEEIGSTFADHSGSSGRWLSHLHGPDVAFGVPGILMLVATVFFWAGRKKFVHLPPVGIGPYLKELRQPENLKALGSLVMLVPFAAVFWSLWQQNFSSWVNQANALDCHLFGVDWLPAQIQTVNPIFILVMLPVFSYGVYPAVGKFVKFTPLRRLGTGLFVTALAFAIIALIQVRIDAGGRPNVIWQVLAFVVLTAAEILVSVTHLEFAYTQAPKKMKSLVMCTYLVSAGLGNWLAAAVNALILKPDGTARLAGANYFWFFVLLMLATGALFTFVARFYRGKTYIQDEAGAQPA
jgi:POT family proton-dependent oligopeptide transporter